jgi:predicted kinase
MATLFLICGLPVAGKTTLAKQLEVSRSALRLCPDEWIARILEDPSDTVELGRLRDPVESLQWIVAQKILSLGVSVILENSFWATQERTMFQSQARALGVSVELHFLDVPKDELWNRLNKRNADRPEGTFVVTKKQLDSWWASFEPPTADELNTYDNHRDVLVEPPR